MFIVNWFQKLKLSHTKNEPWEGCTDSYYVHDFKERIVALAKELSLHTSQRVHARFNVKKKVVELVHDTNGTIASIVVRGEVGHPYEAVVHLKDFSIPTEFFQKVFGKIPVTFHYPAVFA